jgi:multicomponent Na+:H+ antiporter subunit A
VTIWAEGCAGPVDPRLGEEFDGLVFKHWAVLVFITAGALLTAYSGSRMTAVAALGVVGIGVALIFIMFSAPGCRDHAASGRDADRRSGRRRDAEAAASEPEERGTRARATRSCRDRGRARDHRPVAVEQGDIDRRITDYFEIASWPEAFGRNIVNVILVDFRALDTFGEIAVVVIAALAAYALLRGTSMGAQPGGGGLRW